MIRQIKWLKWVYLFLAILGAVLPTLANIEFAKSYGPAFDIQLFIELANNNPCLLYTSPSPRDRTRNRMPSSA